MFCASENEERESERAWFDLVPGIRQATELNVSSANIWDLAGVIHFNSFLQHLSFILFFINKKKNFLNG